MTGQLLTFPGGPAVAPRSGYALRLIDRGGVAEMLGVTREKLYRRLGEWSHHPANPFPAPVLGRGAGARWDPRAIDRWVAAGGEHATAPAGMAADTEDEWAARLDGRALTL